MKIKTKIALSLISVSAMAVALSISIFGGISIRSSKKTLRSTAEQHLVSTTQMQKRTIERYFETIRGQAITLSDSLQTKEAMRVFAQAYAQTGAFLAAKPKQRAELDTYYSEQFAAEFGRRNDGESIDTKRIVQRLSPTAIALQHQYIVRNPNPLGAKDVLQSARSGTSYDKAHQKHHGQFRRFLQEFGFYDIFLVDLLGRVVYSVSKESDFGTSLLEGPYANSNLAYAFKESLKSNRASTTVLTDFVSYLPSYNDPASFVASPIFDDGEKVGVLVFQMPLDRISAALTFNRRWKEVGLGETGESYLVGFDGTVRSLRRGLIEDKKSFFESLEKNVEDKSAIRKMRAKGTTIGLEHLEHLAVERASKGQAGVAEYEYLGEQVLGAYAPLGIGGFNWAVVSEMRSSEALAEGTLGRSLLFWSIVIVLVVAGLSVFVGLFVAGSVTKPITALSEHLLLVIRENRFDVRTHMNSKDEVGQAASAVDELLEGLQSVIHDISVVSAQMAKGNLSVRPQTEYRGDLATIKTGLSQALKSLNRVLGEAQVTTGEMDRSSGQLVAVSRVLAEGAQEQSSAAHESLSALEETSIVASSNAQTAKKVDALSSEAEACAHQGQENMEDLTRAMDQIAESSKAVAQIVKTIDEIAFQTDILALNAAVEAARAGKHGRGFAVVAQQVQNLASRSSASAKKTGALVQRSWETVSKGVVLTETVGESLTKIVAVSSEVSALVQEITSASREQSEGIGHIRDAMAKVNAAAESALQRSTELERTSSSMARDSGKLNTELRSFVLNGAPSRPGGAMRVKHAPIEERSLPSVPQRCVNVPAESLDQDERGFNGI